MIESGINVPGSYIDINSNMKNRELQVSPFVTVVFGEHPVSVDQTELTPKYERVTSISDAYDKYGISVSYEMCKAFFDNIAPGANVEVYCVSKPIPELLEFHITKTIRIEDPAFSFAEQDGVIEIVENGYRYTVPVSTTESGTRVMQKIEEAHNAINFDNASISLERYTNIENGAAIFWHSSTTQGEGSVIIKSYRGGPAFNLQSNTDFMVPTFSTGTLEKYYLETEILLDPLPNSIHIEGTAGAGQTPFSYDVPWKGWQAGFPIWELEGQAGIYRTSSTPNSWIDVLGPADSWAAHDPVNIAPPKTGYGNPGGFQGVLTQPLVYTNPVIDYIDLDEFIAALPESVINLFANPYIVNGEYEKLEAEINRRFSPLVQLEGHQVITRSGTVAEIESLVSGYNDFNLTIWDGGFERPDTNSKQTASICGIMANSLSEDPAVPMMGIPLNNVYAEELKRSMGEKNTLILAGVSPSTTLDKEVRTVRVTTSYTETDGLVDVSYRDANTVFTASYLRQSLLRLIAIQYRNFKLADDGIRAKAGQKIATPKKLTGTILGWFQEMENRAIVENYEQFKTQLVVTRSDSDKTRIDVILPPDVVNQFRIFAGELQFII